MGEKQDAAPRGIFEIELEFTPHAGGPAVRGATTPSMWASADEWADTLRAAGGHTDNWINAKMGEAAYLQAAQAEGLMRPGGISLERIAEMKNAYDVVEIAGADGPGAGGGEHANPTGGGAGA